MRQKVSRIRFLDEGERGKRILEEEQLGGEELRGSRSFVRVYIYTIRYPDPPAVGVPRGLVKYNLL